MEATEVRSGTHVPARERENPAPPAAAAGLPAARRGRFRQLSARDLVLTDAPTPPADPQLELHNHRVIYDLYKVLQGGWKPAEKPAPYRDPRSRELTGDRRQVA